MDHPCPNCRSPLRRRDNRADLGLRGGNSQIDLEFTKPLDEAKLVNEPPLHHKFELPDARLIAAGEPDRSVLVHRLAIRGAGQMPQLATDKVDTRALSLLREWISQLK